MMLAWDVGTVPDDFVLDGYKQYLPDNQEQATYIANLITNKGFGWKSRARVLMRLHLLHRSYDAAITTEQAKLANMAQRLLKAGPGLRKYIQMTPADHLKVYLESLTPEQLNAQAEKNDISWSSYGEDRAGLIGHIIETMAASEVVA